MKIGSARDSFKPSSVGKGHHPYVAPTELVAFWMAPAINIVLLRSRDPVFQISKTQHRILCGSETFPNCRDKVAHFGMVLFAGLGFNSGRHVDCVRVRHLDGSPDILGF
jgi:hypothetical protein